MKECASVWRAKCREFHWENEGVWRPMVLGDPVGSQKMDLEWASVWRSKCRDFHRKTKELRGQWCWGIHVNDACMRKIDACQGEGIHVSD